MSAVPTLPEPDRIASAVDALCAGSPCSVLVHVEMDPSPQPSSPPFALFCTPLPGLLGIGDILFVLGAIDVPCGWRMAGLCAPTVIEPDWLGSARTRRLDAWLIHIVADSGARAGRLFVPDAPELSGPTSPTDPDHELTRCLTRLIHSPERC